MKKKFLESDMYLPIKIFFESIGYSVKSEIKHCDIALVKNERLAIIELKLALNLTLILQAMERQKLCDEVYIAIPRLKNYKSKDYTNIKNLVKRLGLGLIHVAMNSPLKTVEIIVFPDIKNIYTKDNRKDIFINEFNKITFDLNVGGSNKRKIMTSYRENTIKIACIIKAKGEMSAKELMNNYKCEKSTYSVLSANHYEWFVKTKHGVYDITQKCIEDLKDPQFLQLVNHYSNEI